MEYTEYRHTYMDIRTEYRHTYTDIHGVYRHTSISVRRTCFLREREGGQYGVLSTEYSVRGIFVFAGALRDLILLSGCSRSHQGLRRLSWLSGSACRFEAWLSPERLSALDELTIQFSFPILWIKRRAPTRDRS